MSALVFANRNPRPGGGSHTAGKDLLFTAQSIGAVAGLAGGVLAGILGALLTAVGWFIADAGARHLFSVVGTTLLFLTIPLIIFSGYCMDWAEKDMPRRHSDVAPYDEDDEEY